MIGITTRTIVATVLSLAAAPWVASASAASCGGCGDRTADQLWLVDARSGCLSGRDYEGENLRYYLHTDRGWKKSNAEIFNDPKFALMPTVFWVHGDRVSGGEAYSIGKQVYHRLTCQIGNEQPVRFVIFSWPSTKQLAGPLKDARLKFGFTTAAGYRLAYTIAQLPPEAPVSVIAYSYGARVTTAGLHLLGGGEIGRWALVQRPERRAAVRATLLAPALENGLIIPGRGHGLAVPTTERMLVVRNSADRVLNLFRFVYRGGHGPPALGSVGVAPSQLGQFASQFDQFDAACHLGRDHNWQGYFYQRGVLERIRGNLLLEFPAELA
ncbi:MAG: alpha/beta hydrolase, partial [Pirellulales bacterium]